LSEKPFKSGEEIKLRRFAAAVALAFSLLVVPTTLAFAAGPDSLMKVGGDSVSEDDLLYLLTQKAGGNEAVAGMVLSGMTLEEKKDFLKDIADLLLVSQAAARKGIQLDPGVAAKLRWDAVNTLAKAYVERMSAGWDLNEKAIKKYFEAHRENYITKEAVHVRHILAENEPEARTLLLQALSGEDFGELAAKFSKDQGSAERGGDLGWIQKGDTVPEFEQAAFSTPKGGFAGPVRSEYGWHVIQVLDKRPESEGVYEAVKNQVVRDLQQSYLEEALASLRKDASLAIDEKKLEALGK
jgi:peptidyl-prolyl cis-trans isomerase C